MVALRQALHSGERRKPPGLHQVTLTGALGPVISLNGAALIATVYPVGILILTFEIRALLRMLGAEILKRLWLQMIFALVVSSVVATAIASTYLCVNAVSSNVALGGTAADFIFVTGLALGLAVSLGVGATIMMQVMDTE